MATTIDQKVVELKFDNRDFEKNTRQSMSTLEKLKLALHFKGASDGLDEISKAAKKVDMKQLANGVQEVTTKFSIMEIVGTTALVNLTNSAVNTGKQMIKSLTIDQVTSGWDKMASKMSSVQTLVNSTGLSVEEIEGYLDQLMWYSDETSYSFTDMTSALANMTATGGDIAKLIPMIRGMANATAYAGKGSAEFSRVIYNLNQSYGAGYLQLRDWQSVQMSGANSKQLTEELIRAGEELGKIKKGQVTVGNFNQTLKDQWADTKVMELAFSRFDKLSAAAYEAVKQGYVILKDGSTREVHTASEAIALLADQYDELSVKSFRSAQEAKTFKEAIEATADATSTAWMSIFSSIFGTYDDQKRIFTSLANWLYKVFVEPIYKIQEVVDEAFNFKGIEEMWAKITKPLDDINEKIQGSTHTLEEYQNMVSRIWRGDFKNQPYRKALVEAEGYNYSVTQSLVNLTAALDENGQGWKQVSKLTKEDVIRLEKEYGITVEEVTDSLTGEKVAVESLTDEKLKELGLTEDEIEMYRRLEKGAHKYGLSLDELVDKMINRDARSLLFGKKAYDENGIEQVDEYGNAIYEVYGIAQNIAGFLHNIFSAIGKAWNDTIGKIISVDLYMFISRINDATARLREMTANGNSQGMKNLTDTFKGLFSILRLIGFIMGGAFRIGWTIFKTVLATLGYDVLDFTGALGNLITRFVDFIVNNDFVIRGIVLLTTVIAKAIRSVHDFAARYISLNRAVEAVCETFKVVGGWFKKIYGKYIKPVLSEFLSDLKHFFAGIKTADNIPRYIFEGIIKGSKKWGGKAWNALSSLFKWIYNGLSKIFTSNNMKKFIDFASYCVNGFIKGLKKWIPKSLSVIGEWAKKILSTFAKILKIHSPSKEFYTFGENIVQGLFNGIANTVKMVYTLIMTIGQTIIDIVKDMNLGGIIATLLASGLVVGFVNITKAIKNIGDAIGSFEYIAKGFAKLEKNLGTKFLMSGIKDVAIAIGILTASIFALCLMHRNYKDDFWSAYGMLAALTGLIAALVLVAAGATRLSGNGMGNGKAFKGIFGAILAIGIAMALMSKALKNLKDVDDSKVKILWEFLKIIGIILAIGALANFQSIKGFGASINGAGSSGISAMGSNISKLGGILLSIGALFLIMGHVVKSIGKLKPERFEQGIKALYEFTTLVSIMLGMMAIIAYSGGTITLGFGVFAGIAAVFLIMGHVVKSIGKLDENRYDQGMEALNKFVALIDTMLTLLAVAAFGNGGIKNGSKLLFGIAALFLAMSYAVKILGTMSLPDIGKGGIAVVGLLILAGLFVLFLDILPPGEINDISKVILGIAALLAAMTLAVWLLGQMDADAVWRGVGVVTVLLILCAALTYFVSKSPKGADKALFGLAAVIAVLALSVGLLSLINWKKLIAPVVAIGILLGALAVLLLMSKNMASSWQSFAIIVAIVAVLITILVALKQLSKIPFKSLMGAVLAIVLILAALVGVVYLLGKINTTNKNTIAGVVMLTVIMIALKELVKALVPLANAGNITGAVIAVIAVLAALIGAIALLTIVGQLVLNNAAGALAGLIGLVALIGALYLVVLVTKEISKVNDNGLIKKVLIVVGVLGALIILVGLLSIIGAIVTANLVGTLAGLVGLVVLIGALYLAVLVLKEMSKIKDADKNVKLILTLLGGLGVMLAALGVLGPLITAGMPVLAELGIMLGVLAVVLLAIGALADHYPKMQEFIEKGKEILVLVAGALGEAIGAFISGMIDKLSEIMPTLGERLTLFAQNAGYFFEWIQTLNKSMIGKTGILVGIIAAMTASDFIASVETALSKLIGGDNGLVRLAEGFSTFANSLSPFITLTASLPPNALNSVGTLTDIIFKLTAASLLDAITAFGNKKSSLELFAEVLPKLGKGFSEFAKSLGNFSSDTTNTIKTAVEAIAVFGAMDIAYKGDNVLEKAISVMSNLYANFAQWIGMDSDLELLSKGMVSLGDGLADFADSLEDIDDDDIEHIKTGVKAISSLADIGEEIEQSAFKNLYDNLSKIFGADDDYTLFAKGMKRMARTVKSFSEILSESEVTDNITHTTTYNKGIDTTRVEAALKLLRFFVDFADDLAYMDLGNWNTDLKDTCNDLKQALPVLGEALVSFVNTASDLSDVDTSRLAIVLENVKMIIETLRNGIVTGFNDALNEGGSGSLSYAIGKFYQDVQELCQRHASGGENTSIDLSGAGTALANAILTGMSEGFEYANIKTKIDEFIKNLISAIESENNVDLLSKCGNRIGNYLKDGFLVSVTDNNFRLKARLAGAALYTEFEKGFKKKSDSHSPSKEAMKLGNFVGEGFIIGISQYSERVYDVGQNVANNAQQGLASAISKVSSLVESEVKNPTIRPVLDLSDVSDGAGLINSMFTNPTMQVASNLSSISYGMNNRNQNGTADLLNAIDKLGRNIGNTSGNTYNINGVTYDDGSNINRAVEELVRAIEVERRV